MPQDFPNILRTAQNGFSAQEAELAATWQRQLVTVVTKTTTGSGDINETVDLDRKFRLVFVRCHFVGGSGSASLAISVDSQSGSAYDTQLFAITQAGTTKDVNLRIGDGDVQDPSPWTFQAGDSVRIQWANPDSGNMSWGLEVGLALAS
jgi:hypothetical protein